jgi:type I restriction enzyme S subunit
MMLETKNNQNLQDLKMNKITENKSSKSANSENPTSDKWEIPSDWEVRNVGEICDFIVPGRNKPIFFDGEIPWITTPDLLNNFRVFKSKIGLKITKEEAKKIGSKIVPKDSVIMSCVGDLGLLSISGCEIVINQQLHAFIPLDRIDYRFLFFALSVQKRYMERIATKTAVPYLNKDNCNSIPIPLPPLPEQKAIASLLSKWDEVISKNQALIQQKEERKKWLMQNLLTGKKRLKGFEGEWEEIHISDIAQEISIKNKSDKQLTVLSCTKYNGLVPSLEYFGRKIFADDVSTYKIVPKNHFAYATNHIEEGSLGYQKIFNEALISPMYTVFKTDDNINDDFFYKLLKSHNMVSKYQARMEGSIDRRGGLRWSAFSIIKINLPSYDEQTAIAQVLQAADKEIQLLKTKADKLKEQKKGLMQVLLTGKKRLKITTI